MVGHKSQQKNRLLFHGAGLIPRNAGFSAKFGERLLPGMPAGRCPSSHSEE
jgi:hypothetical protein